MTSPDIEPFWPDWKIANPQTESELKELARYASERFVVGKGLVPHEPSIADSAADSEYVITVLEEIFRLLVDKFGYRLRPWHHDKNYQRIRDVDQVLSEGGTCLDIALLTAAVCMSSYLRPFIVYATAPRHQHMFLAVDSQPDRREMDPWGPSRSDEATAYYSAAEMPAEIERRKLVLFDPTDVTVKGITFDRLMERSKVIVYGGPEGSDYIAEPDGFWLIDVKTCHFEFARDEVRLYEPVRERSQITTYLPDLTTNFIQYASRESVLADLNDRARASKYVVVRGEAGVGKSLLALEVARKADHGCGWFLDASSPSTLERSLAAAELAEHGNPDLARLSRGDDRESLAKVARSRLHTSKQPWIVVIDNANGNLSSDYRKWLPKPGDNQSLIITSTNPTWDELCEGGPVIVDPLPPEELEKLVPEALVDATQGLPLLVSAVAALPIDATLDRLSRSSSDRETALRLLEMAREDHPECQALDEFLAKAGWLPAAGFPLHQISNWAHRSLISWLADRALLQTSGRQESIRIHRTFGAALRELYQETGIDSALEILTAPEAVDLLDETTVVELATLADYLPTEEADAASSDIDSTIVGHAFHTLGKIKELHGDQKSSGNFFQLAADWLHDDTEHQLLLADCKHGLARRLFQRVDANLTDLTAATELATEAQRLSEAVANSTAEPEEQAEARIARARSRALEGLIQRKRISLLFNRDDVDRTAYRQGLEKAKAIIEEAHRTREQDAAGDPELARSRYNFAGVYIGLAKSADTLNEALDNIAEADSVYNEVKLQRERIYRRPVHPHIAACVWGLGVTAYYRGLFATDGTERIAELMLATTHGVESLGLRQQLDESAVGTDVAKSRNLLYKAQILTNVLSNREADLGSVEDRIKLDALLDTMVKGLVANSASLGGLLR